MLERMNNLDTILTRLGSGSVLVRDTHDTDAYELKYQAYGLATGEPGGDTIELTFRVKMKSFTACVFARNLEQLLQELE